MFLQEEIKDIIIWRSRCGAQRLSEEEHRFLKEVLEDVNQQVQLTDRYTKYKYVNLEEKLLSFHQKSHRL